MPTSDKRASDGFRHAELQIYSAEVVTIGETMVLFWPADGSRLEDATLYERSFGGAESNLCIALARLGHTVRWISRLGDDAFGRYVRAALVAQGVQVDAPASTAAPTAVFFKERSASGRRVLYYRRSSAASQLRPHDLSLAQFIGARVVHLTGITPALSSTCDATVVRAIELARTCGALVSIDPNVRPQLWPDLESCRARLSALVSQADVVLLGHEDAAVLFPGLADEKILQAVRELGPTTAVLKLGERGALAVEGDDWGQVAAYPARVVDTVGAGDGFDAGYISGWLRGYSLEDSLKLAARIGAAAVSASGDWEGYPTSVSLLP